MFLGAWGYWVQKRSMEMQMLSVQKVVHWDLVGYMHPTVVQRTNRSHQEVVEQQQVEVA
jgi:hypothetical protein